MTDNYLTVLEESLQKKYEILQKIQELSKLQQDAFLPDNVDLEKFDYYVNEKDKLIDEIAGLDSGFETLYQKVSAELVGNKEKYKEEIKRLQTYVSKVTELSVAIQAQEARNKKMIEDYFGKTRKTIGRNRKNSRAAYDYYKSMSGSGLDRNGIMDSKQ